MCQSIYTPDSHIMSKMVLNFTDFFAKKNEHACQGDMDIMSIHLCIHFSLHISDNCLLNINEILYRILQSESNREWGGIGMLLCGFEDNVKELSKAFQLLWRYMLVSRYG